MPFKNTPSNAAHRRRRLAAACALALLTSGCASLPDDQPRDERDPWERYNRAMYSFNESVDRAVFKPVATAYKTVVPRPVRTGIGNFFGNLGDVWSFVNNVLQGKAEGALTSFWRVAINTTIGLGGVFDAASDLQLERQPEDFGQTLGVWGVGSGPYLVLPLFGPSSLRDTVAMPVNYYGSPLTYFKGMRTRNTLTFTRVVHTRASLLEVTDILQGASLDDYSFTRDAYLQKRRNDIYDGNPPQDEERYDLDEPEEPQP
ncbi:MAG: VacJ family lipoprotein [Ottowia sp.]|nr:VacJ family lipoprotein [Ottowia sp.]